MSTVKVFTFFSLLLLLVTSANAEYRVYQYYVRSKVANLNPTQATIITSTLDPASYAAYNGGKTSVEVNLLRSWICYGNTSKKAPCTISEGRELSEDYAP